MKIGIISPYPSKGSKHVKESGVASYTKNLAHSIKNLNHSVFVFANKIGPNSKYTENGIIVSRCWNKGIKYPFQIYRNILIQKKQINIIHIQYEIFLYGGLVSILAFLLLLILLKIIKILTIVTIHQIVPLSKVNKQFLNENFIGGEQLLLKMGLFILIRFITFLSNMVIVHEPSFKKTLLNEYKCKGKKISVIPHGIEEKEDLMDKRKAKEILGLKNRKIILFLGYVTGYKGIELLINSFKYLKSNFTLLIVGGKHPRLKRTPSYQQYLSTLKKRAADISKNIIFTDFIPEKQLPVFLSATDLVIFPYTLVMSSSGPMSLVIAYEKPFLVSDAYRDIIQLDAVLFPKNPKDLADKIKQFFENKTLKTYTSNFIKKIKEKRSWKTVARQTVELYKKVLYMSG